MTLKTSNETRSSGLVHHLRALRPYLDDKDLTEICINRPGEVFLESQAGWTRVNCPGITDSWCQVFPVLVATYSGQRIGEAQPLLSGSLPDGERVQVVVPPVVERGTVSVTIRKPSMNLVTRAAYEAAGLTSEVGRTDRTLSGEDTALIKLYDNARYWDFIEAAVVAKKNIVISGATGSGKTTFGKTIVSFIPAHERVVTIEDVREMFLPSHPNKVHMLYSEGSQGRADVSAKTLLQAALRMKPDRILLAEIRSKVAYDYIVNVSSGHPGSITTVHANSAAEAYEMLMLRVKESEEGRELSRSDILDMLRAKIDIVIQLKVLERKDHQGRIQRERRITEIHYDPAHRHQQFA